MRENSIIFVNLGVDVKLCIDPYSLLRNDRNIYFSSCDFMNVMSMFLDRSCEWLI